jgi:ADP-heptose:LPS heptosyltransferase
MSAINKPASQSEGFQKTVAILQMTRLGDIIQTVQAIESFKENYPNYKLVLIGRAQFVNPLKFLLDEHFDAIYPINTEQVFVDFQNGGYKKSVLTINSFLDQIKQENIDVLVNLSFSSSSGYLASLIPAAHKVGLFQNEFNKVQINDKWSQILYSTVMRGIYNPFSLVDLYKNIIGLKPLAKLPATASRNTELVVVHPFASTERKSWKIEKWVELIYKTLKENDRITLSIVGAKNEMARSLLISENPLLKQFSQRIVNLTGRTSIKDMSEVLKGAQLFVGHDSMVGHLAALYKTPTLTISLGNVRPFETTPYAANAYNIAPRTKCFPCFPTDKCEFTQCHHDISYQLVNGAIKELLSGKSLTKEWLKSANSSFHLTSAIVYRSQSENGLMGLENLSDTLLDSNEIFRTLYKLTWSFIIGDQELNYPFPALSSLSHRDLLEAMNGLQHLYELSEFGKKYSRFILEEISGSTPSINKIKEFSKKIDEIDHLQSLVQKTSPQLAPIIDYFKVRKGNLFGSNIVQLTESSYLCFEECANISSVMYELISNTIAEHKISQSKNKSRMDLNK